MKITNHKDGSRSYKFSPQEQVHESSVRAKALYDQASASGGVSATIAELLVFDRVEQVKYITAFGTEALEVMMEICMKAEETPFGQGCKEAVLGKPNKVIVTPLVDGDLRIKKD